MQADAVGYCGKVCDKPARGLLGDYSGITWRCEKAVGERAEKEAVSRGNIYNIHAIN